jgi:ribosome biogenesis ATPase
MQELGVPFISISAPSIVSGMSGESEKTLRDTFDEAKVSFLKSFSYDLLNSSSQRVAPCLLFIDEIDAITPKRESAQREMERRIVAQFLTCMDGKNMSVLHHISASDARHGRYVLGQNGQ